MLKVTVELPSAVGLRLRARLEGLSLGTTLMCGLMSVAEVAQALNVTRGYVVGRLLREDALGPVFVMHGCRYVLRAKVEAYRHRRRRVAGKALRELARESQEAALYEKTKLGI
jgi:hypothetical protein